SSLLSHHSLNAIYLDRTTDRIYFIQNKSYTTTGHRYRRHLRQYRSRNRLIRASLHIDQHRRHRLWTSCRYFLCHIYYREWTCWQRSPPSSKKRLHDYRGFSSGVYSVTTVYPIYVFGFFLTVGLWIVAFHFRDSPPPSFIFLWNTKNRCIARKYPKLH